MRKSIYFFGTFMGLLLLASCSSIRVFTDYDIEVDFANYSSFAFYKPSIDQAEISDLDKRRILKSIESQMTAKGYVLAENADLLVSIATDEESRVDINNQAWGFGWGWGFNPWMWGPINNQTVSTYDRGVLLIDILDANKKQLIWQGKGSGILTNVTNPEGRQKLIDRYVSAILNKYPIR